MAIVAPFSKYKKHNMLIITAVLIGLSGWFAYDGYFKESFIEKHTEKNEAGEEVMDSTLAFHRKSPPFFMGAGLVVLVLFFMKKNKKVIADENSLKVNNLEIPYDSIEKINKAPFDKKGYFILTYKEDDRLVDVRLSDRDYDNMPAVLEELVKQIS